MTDIAFSKQLYANIALFFIVDNTDFIGEDLDPD